MFYNETDYTLFDVVSSLSREIHYRWLELYKSLLSIGRPFVLDLKVHRTYSTPSPSANSSLCSFISCPANPLPLDSHSIGVRLYPVGTIDGSIPLRILYCYDRSIAICPILTIAGKSFGWAYLPQSAGASIVLSIFPGCLTRLR